MIEYARNDNEQTEVEDHDEWSTTDDPKPQTFFERYGHDERDEPEDCQECGNAVQRCICQDGYVDEPDLRADDRE